MGAIPLPKTCGLYLPGHEVHWIQGIHSSDPDEVPPVPCRVAEVHEDGTVVVEVGCRLLELWTYDPVRLEAIVAQYGASVSYQERWRLLRVPHVTEESGLRAAYCIDVTTADNPERRPCPTGPLRFTSLAERLMVTGGFTVRGPDPFDLLGAPAEGDSD